MNLKHIFYLRADENLNGVNGHYHCYSVHGNQIRYKEFISLKNVNAL